MNFQTELQQLILAESPRVATLRQRAVNGDQQTLEVFCQVIQKMLAHSNNHSAAYRQVNELILTAHPHVVAYVDSQIVPTLVDNHCLSELDEYVILWKRLLPGSGRKANYPDLSKKLSKISIKNQNRSHSAPFLNYSQTFEKNFIFYDDKKVQFFEDFDGDSFASSSIEDENSQNIFELDLIQIKEIRKNLQNGQVDELTQQQYLLKAMNFLSLKPKVIRQQLKPQYNQSKIWAKNFIQSRINNKSNANLVNMKKQKDNEPKISNNNNIELKRYHNQKSQKIGTKEIINLPSKNQMKDNDSGQVNIEIHQQAEEVSFNSQQNANRRSNSKRFQITKGIQIPKRDQFKQNDQSQQISNLKNLKLSNKNPDDSSNNTIKLIKQPQIQPKQHKFHNVRMTSPQVEPKFILDTDEMKIAMNQNSQISLGSNNSRVRRKIFSGQHSRLSQSPREEQLLVIKHGKKQAAQYKNNGYYIKMAGTGNALYQTPAHNITPVQSRTQVRQYTQSPNTAFGNRTMYGSSSCKKLSEFNQEKRERKQKIVHQALTPIEDYLLIPYLQNFNNINNFNRFRRNCLEDEFTLYTSPLLEIQCLLSRISPNKIRVQLIFTNKANSSLLLQTIYRVPKSMEVEKLSVIKKKFSLSTSYTHIFSLQLIKFPLQPCLINLKYGYESNCPNFKEVFPTVICMPLTMRNFVDYILLTDAQWMNLWGQWVEHGHRIVKNIILEPHVLTDAELSYAFKQFANISPVENYSVKQFGAYCTQHNFQGLQFLIRISQRVQNIITLELLANQKGLTQDEKQYLDHCLSIWSLLLAKIQVVFSN